jgi:starch synthase
VKILYASSEAVPYYKTGGLADVARSLPEALAERGHEVLIAHPYYRGVRALELRLDVADITRLPWHPQPVPVRYLVHRGGGAATLFVDQPHFFDTDRPYLDRPGDPFGTGRRFAFFARAVVERARAWGADVVHLNDWQTGLVPAYGLVDGLPAATVFAIHNLAYQGNYPPELLWQVGLPWELFQTEGGLEYHRMVSFLKGGLSLADFLVTVSPTYSREIQGPAFGMGLEGVLQHRQERLRGILNGIDTRLWDPATDPALPVPYDAGSPAGKAAAKGALLAELGLEAGGPLLVLVSRLAWQKGIDLLVDALPRLVHMGARVAVLGDGDGEYVDALTRAATRAPGRVAARFRFDDALARRMYAGGDLFLMPSRYEPCGLGQMIAQRYGTPPVARLTGGLADTVSEGVTGFTFADPHPESLAAAVARGLTALSGEDGPRLIRRCMELDSSWTRSAARYELLYTDALAARAG